MSFELQYKIFSESEITQALAGALNSRIGFLPGVPHLKIERITEKSIVVSFQKNEFGVRDRQVIAEDELADALGKWCRSKGFSVPAGASSKILKVGKVLCLRISSNIREEKVGSVEQLILRGAS